MKKLDEIEARLDRLIEMNSKKKNIKESGSEIGRPIVRGPRVAARTIGAGGDVEIDLSPLEYRGFSGNPSRETGE